MKITYNSSECVGCGVCVALCPKYFEMKAGKAHLRGSKPGPGFEVEELIAKNTEECVEEAVNGCPAQCIQVVTET